MKKKNKRFSIILKIIGLVFITCSIILVIYNLLSDYWAGKMSKAALDGINPIIEGNRNENKPFDANDDMPTTIIDGNEYIGIITMETVDIKLPVLKEYSPQNLKIAPTLYKGSIYKDNAIIIAHNSKTQFKRIQNLNIGDSVIFEDINGNVFKYVVASTERISEKDIDLVMQGDWDLTLFTCDNNIRFRSTIRLIRI